MPTMKVEDAAVVLHPYSCRVSGMGEPHLGAGAEHRIGDFPRMAIEEEKAGFALEHVIPEVEEQRGARVLPTPRTTGLPARGGERRGLLAKGRQLPGIKALALRPAPVA